MNTKPKFKAWINEQLIEISGNLYISFFDDPVAVDWEIRDRTTMACIYKHDESYPEEYKQNKLIVPTGRKLNKGQDLFEYDIVFDEIEEEDGDRRLYYVCKYIPEWGKFVFLTYGEHLLYEDCGIGSEGLEDDGTFSIEWSENYHYAGNYFQNPELLER